MVYRYRYRKFDKEKLLYILIFILLIISSFVLISEKKMPVKLPEISSLPELSIIGFILVQPSADVVEGRGVVSLTGGCYQVTATTDQIQAESIKNGIAGIIVQRPNTHDLIKDAFDSLGIQVVMVKVVDLKDNNFIGRLILRQGNNVLSLDSRPSDGIALAVRTNSSIYFKESLMKEKGKYIC